MLISTNVALLSHAGIHSTLDHGYSDGKTVPESAIESDASKSVVHLDWQLPQACEHNVFACCIKAKMPFPEIAFSTGSADNEPVVELKIQQQIILIPYAIDFSEAGYSFNMPCQSDLKNCMGS